MGTYTETDARDRIWTILRDYGSTTAQQLLNDTEIVSIGVRGAEPIYSRIRPRTVISNLTANGTNFLALPVSWVEGFSTIDSIESPPDQVPAQTLDPRTYYIGRDTNGAQRIVFEDPPANAATVRIAFGAPRIFAALAVNTTVLDIDFTAVCTLAASLCADAVAAKYARTSEPAYNADAVNYRSRAQEWQSVAKRLWTIWQATMGVGSEGEGGGSAPAAGVTVNWDSRASWGGWRYNHARSER